MIVVVELCVFFLFDISFSFVFVGFSVVLTRFRFLGVSGTRAERARCHSPLFVWKRWWRVLASLVLFIYLLSKMATTDRERNKQLEAIAVLLEELARKIRLLKVTEPATGPNFHVGQKVRCIRKEGKYQGRTGVLVSRRGTMFWNLRLDATITEAACSVFMMETSLSAVKP